MADSPRLPPDSYPGRQLPSVAGEVPADRDGTYSLENVDRKLVDENSTDWEPRITLQGLPVIPVSAPSDYSLVRVPVVDNDDLTKSRKRKASVVRVLSDYWDNRAELHQFGQQAQWLHKRLTGSQHKTRLIFPDNMKPAGRRKVLASIAMWESVVESWLFMSSSERARALDAHLKHVIIADDDSRTALRGQSGVVAACDIDPCTVLGPYVGRYCHGQDTKDEVSLHGDNVGRYAVDCSLGKLRLDVCGYGYGNITVCINANTTYQPDEPKRAANAFFVLVIYRGWPYVFVTSDRAIEKGEEILIDYGRYYWRGY